MNNHQHILDNLAKHITLSEEEQTHFISLLKMQPLGKREYLQQAGDRCYRLAFINSGILRSFVMGPDGKESTIMFGMKDWWITDMYCFVNELPAMMSIQALEDSEVITLEKHQLDQLYIKYPKFERFFRILMQNAYTREQLRTIQNLTLPAETRYRNFLEKYPELSNLISQKQLASYLGITPEFLSMIRARKD